MHFSIVNPYPDNILVQKILSAYYVCCIYLNALQTIRIYHEYEIEKSVKRFTDFNQEACRVMTIGDREGWISLSHPHTNYGFFFLLTI